MVNTQVCGTCNQGSTPCSRPQFSPIFLNVYFDAAKGRSNFDILVSMKWKVPPRIKVHEALGAIGDKRIEIDGNTAKVYSSSGNKFYTVTYNPETHALMVNDNGSYWKGYLGYPAIAFLMMVGKIPYTQEQAEACKDIGWKDINTKFKNDFDKTLQYIHKVQKERGIKVKDFEREIDGIYTSVGDNLPTVLGEKARPPEGY